ncbi:UvrD-helicase domain-containing protein, partial [Bacteroidota bacterium]
MTRLTPHQLKALDYGRHISLTANAGSGKTFILSKRYVEIAVNENLSLNSIVAITFTDKAAGELNKKIAAEIDDRLLNESDPEKNKILSRLRRQLVSANISTIHSFCVNILREFSPEAGLDARFNPIDQKVADEIIDLTIEESLNYLIRNEKVSENLKYLMRFFGSKKLLVAQLRILIHSRRNIIKLTDELYSKSESEIASHFNNYFQEGIKEIFQTDIKNVIPVIAKINSEVLQEAKNNSNAVEIYSLLKKLERSENIIQSLSLLGLIRNLLLINKGTVRQQGYLKKNMIELLAKEIEIAEIFFHSIKGIEIPEDYEKSQIELARFGKILLDVFQFINSKYSDKKKQKGFLDFEDILLFTQDLIRQEEVRKYLNERFKYIMVDEYQDTNEIQYNIFMPILDHLKSGNLFVVGDEKQSIYMFRDAELEIFNRTKTEIVNEADQASLLQLPHSFRLAPQIALFTNSLFKKLFRNPDKKFNEVEYNELVCAKSKDEKGGVEILTVEESEAEFTESELVASRIAKFVSEESSAISNFSDIAILCRKRSAFAELENAFLKFKIPFIIVGGKGFYQKHIIYDLYNYLSFLLNKKNDSALVGILRSPFFTISDLELFKISLE